jgi:predicted aspartyl protease
MSTATPPSISSFVIRFVVDTGANGYRGEIRHIQTYEEIHFNTWDEAVEFIQRYVPLNLDKTELQ